MQKENNVKENLPHNSFVDVNLQKYILHVLGGKHCDSGNLFPLNI